MTNHLNTVITPWGSYEYIFINVEHQIMIKKLIIKQGHRFSLQYHKHRKETWTILNKYSFEEIRFMIIVQPRDVTNLQKEIITDVNDDPIVIRANYIHRAEALKEDLIILEDSRGSYNLQENTSIEEFKKIFEEDIIRLHDDYNR